MSFSLEVTLTFSLTYEGQAPLEICRPMLLAQDWHPPASCHTDCVELKKKRHTDPSCFLSLHHPLEATACKISNKKTRGGAECK